ncbi:serine hydrolase domain-containing protein [Alkalicoccus urumqiensis]|uniref:Beta-lactamase-related domain-containing protein n=1 Tax=Alkalicoccus urumqiensis TaxID=1548213 RepID=A0A2P6MKV8_ALKUR|nr:serine hydrolase [Alkalicoccus urumqiensis]PRO66919.1 hypothetical protein C6I21_03070 [Alkalicoccus urumqiensis]
MNKADLQKEHAAYHMAGGAIYQNGKPLFHYVDRSQNEKKPVNSVTKSIVSILTAAALEKEDVSAERPISDFLSVEGPAGSLTVDTLWKMRSGFTDDVWKKRQEDSWLKPFMKESPPGGEFTYSNTDSFLLAAVLHEVTGGLADFADEILFRPAEVSDWTFDTAPEGIPAGAYGIRLLPGDLLKTAEFIRATAAGETSLPASWVTEGWKAESKTGMRGQQYGRHWWIEPASGIPYAAGRFGKIIAFIPEHNVSAAFVGDLQKEELLPFRWFMQFAKEQDWLR